MSLIKMINIVTGPAVKRNHYSFIKLPDTLPSWTWSVYYDRKINRYIRVKHSSRLMQGLIKSRVGAFIVSGLERLVDLNYTIDYLDLTTLPAPVWISGVGDWLMMEDEHVRRVVRRLAN